MPPMIATPVAPPQHREQESDQEFELDIRVSSVNTFPTPIDGISNAITCGTCYTHCGCTSYTCHTACTNNNRCCTG